MSQRLFRFCAVGASGVLVNSVMLHGLAGLAGLPLMIAAALATETAILSNFALNDAWTFGRIQRRHRTLVRALRYNAVCLGGLVISVSAMAMTVELLRAHYLIANLFGIGLATAWNFAVNAHITWVAPLDLRAFRRVRPAREDRLAPISVQERDPWT